MFYNRVLPPPSVLSTASIAEQHKAGRDSLFQDQIMTGGEPNYTAIELNLQTSSSPFRRNLRSFSDRGSLGDHEESVPPKSIQRYNRRKRSISQLSTITTRRSSDHLPSISATGIPSRSTTSASDVCLCQPDPKVPRPRNAFILYRQHHQAAVVAQNPGLANPEISKIIGDHWRTSTAETKAHWKGLAEEEKIRHQKQYPDYRYQPRRSGRNSDVNSLSPAQPENARCSKCGGKSISSTTMQAPNISNASTPITSYNSPLENQTPTTTSDASRFLRSTNSPSFPPSPSSRSHPNPVNTSSNTFQHASPRDSRFNDADTYLSQDTKRRRFGNGQHFPVRMGNNAFTNSHKLTPFPFNPSSSSTASRRESLPRPDFMPSKSQQFTMAAPPRPLHRTSTAIAHPDTSLTLAPLKTSSVSFSEQAKSVEAMVMSIPPLNKIRVLAKISPPLSTPGPGSPTPAVRGAVIAVDGTDREGVNMVIKYLAEVLERDGEHKVRVWDRISGFADAGPQEEVGREEQGYKGFEDYLKLITSFHGVSKEVIEWITTESREERDDEENGQKGLEKERRDMPKTHMSPPVTSAAAPTAISATTGDEASSPVSSSPQPQNLATSDCACASSPPNEPLLPQKFSSPFSTQSSLLPIALLPCYQLSLTDYSASRVPITDAYAPIDHWQWMATLWRGVVGPDITILVSPQHPAPNLHQQHMHNHQHYNNHQPPLSGSAISSASSSSATFTLSTAATIGTARSATPTPPSSISTFGIEGETPTIGIGLGTSTGSATGNISPRIPPPQTHSLTLSSRSSPKFEGGEKERGGVEVRLHDARAIVLRGVGERELRRVGFEVGEWIRAIGEGNGR